MKRLTTDHPDGNFETIMNLVYGKDGWQYIRHGEKDMPTTDFCLGLCKEYRCDDIPPDLIDTEEKKDNLLCGCLDEMCPVATVYAALSGFGHVRDRLKMYEDKDELYRESNHIADDESGNWIVKHIVGMEENKD